MQALLHFFSIHLRSWEIMAKSSISGLPGRATPRSKTRSSLSSIPKATTSASSSSTPTSTNPFTPQLTKAAKRAAKRAELLSQTANKAAVVASNSGIQTGPLGLTKDLKDGSATVLNLSKSSLRRIKRRMKENLAGNKGGMSELQRAVEEVEGSSPKVGSAAVVEEPGEEEEDDLEYQAGVESTNPSSSSSSSARVAKNGAVSAKARKRAL
ncbi:hypothetical protein IE53DRAFT_369065 [Violaceomyces palustris]|uniref:Uncharacterized protein n=1 Tax=Violaceomyces palustris TaxID=1673888 RepID=A0ACD0NWU8_9BASI|nr:hypothetical protein IE53DRAFT_369065 [Violaceomyces palustris]